MKRAPIVLGATAASLAAVLGFHTSNAPISLGSFGSASAGTSPGASTTTSAPPSSSGSSGGSSGGSTNTTTAPSTSSTAPASGGGSTTPTTSAPAPTTTSGSSGTRTATGPQVNYYFGVLSVSVTANGKHITKVGIASLNDGGNYRSQSIDQQSIPMLEQQAMQAQSANIQGIGGASYTSAGFQQSLQGALKKLGI